MTEQQFIDNLQAAKNFIASEASRLNVNSPRFALACKTMAKLEATIEREKRMLEARKDAHKLMTYALIDTAFVYGANSPEFDIVNRVWYRLLA